MRKDRPATLPRCEIAVCTGTAAEVRIPG